MIKFNAGPHQQPRTYPLKQRHDDKADDGGHGDHGKGGQTETGQHLVVYLKHVDGKRQLHDVDEQAEKKA